MMLVAGPARPGCLVVERATAFVRLTVHSDGEGFRWGRTAGPARPGSLSCADPALLALLPDTTATGAVLTLPEVRPPGLVFHTRGSTSLLAAASTGDGPRVVTEALAATGRALRALHGVVVPHGTPGAPPAGPVRLSRWLAGAAQTPAAGRLHVELSARLGPSRVRWLREWTDAVLLGGTTLVHGGPSLGQIVPPDDGVGPVAVLTGEDVTAGHPGADLGWLLGELVELGRGGRRSWVGPAAGALVSGYGAGGAGELPAGTARACAVRMATHLHDYAAYVGWHDDLPARLHTIAELVDDPAAALVRVVAGTHDRQEQP
ncbi:phosphotransferase family protein [uncultured Modestobacter sp.]|uniref:phosphotransferase family protein n=1 Tax=uncultured Modestobacter sp. TaxID=380048 RepID=UPI0026127D08|nr:phosphotransferase [uncultured Modestobacter sp.]